MKKIILILILIAVIAAGGFGAWKILIQKEKGGKGDVAPSPSPSLTQEPPEEIPLAHQIQNVPYYSEKNFCYGASAMMILGYYGFSEEEVQNYRNIVKTKGKGGPPDAFLGFEEYDLVDNVHIAYSQNYNSRDAQFYDRFLKNADQQKIIFADQEQALKKLKELVSQNILVITLIQQGNHYVVVTGYDEGYIYINDPDPDFKQRKMALADFLAEWRDYKQDVGGNIGFPGEYGMIWLDR